MRVIEIKSCNDCQFLDTYLLNEDDFHKSNDSKNAKAKRLEFHYCTMIEQPIKDSVYSGGLVDSDCTLKIVE